MVVSGSSPLRIVGLIGCFVAAHEVIADRFGVLKPLGQQLGRRNVATGYGRGRSVTRLQFSAALRITRNPTLEAPARNA